MKTGVWLIGAFGGVATTVIAGTRAIARGLTSAQGLITLSRPFSDLPLPNLHEIVFGGHDIRESSVYESALQISRDVGSIRHDILEAIRGDLDETSRNVRPGILYHSGRAIEKLTGQERVAGPASCKASIERLAQDMQEFRARLQIDRLVVVNLASTEPEVPPHPDHECAEGIERLLDQPNSSLIASSLYALAAAQAGAAYVNFTPSSGALLPGVQEKFLNQGLPFAGSDGKTGETLVKSALLPLFKYRNLRVLTWQGYNLLGDRDGEVLSEEANKQSKIRSKDRLLHEYLGYPLHSRVEIDFVPSLGDFKTAWDFVHFRGFLDVKMAMQFTWQGCDSVLAAPLVIDLFRFAALALERGEAGALPHLAIFFKSPIGFASHDLHNQYESLVKYAEDASREPRR